MLPVASQSKKRHPLELLPRHKLIPKLKSQHQLLQLQSVLEEVPTWTVLTEAKAHHPLSRVRILHLEANQRLLQVVTVSIGTLLHRPLLPVHRRQQQQQQQVRPVHPHQQVLPLPRHHRRRHCLMPIP